MHAPNRCCYVTLNCRNGTRDLIVYLFFAHSIYLHTHYRLNPRFFIHIKERVSIGCFFRTFNDRCTVVPFCFMRSTFDDCANTRAILGKCMWFLFAFEGCMHRRRIFFFAFGKVNNQCHTSMDVMLKFYRSMMCKNILHINIARDYSLDKNQWSMGCLTMN